MQIVSNHMKKVCLPARVARYILEKKKCEI